MAKKGTHGATVKTKLMCNIYEQVRPLCESDCQAMIVAWQHAERIVLDLTIPTPEDYAAAEAMEPELMQRLRETIAENEQAKAATAQMGEESFANWLMEEVSDIVSKYVRPERVYNLLREIGNTIFCDDGSGMPVLKFGREAGEESDVLADMREELSETTDPRPTEDQNDANVDAEIPETTGLTFSAPGPEPEPEGNDYVRVVVIEGPIDAGLNALVRVLNR